MTVTPRVCLAVAAGGALGALARHLLDTWAPAGAGFPWTTFGINVMGSMLLAVLPGMKVVRRSPTWTAALGPGALGGFTTLSAYSEQTRALLDGGRVAVAAAYLVGTMAAALVAVALASHWSSPLEQALLEAEGGDR